MRFTLSQVALAALCMAASSAHALGLGRLNVHSALGETLKAEIELSSLSDAEAASLKVKVAPPDAYRASGLEYNAVLPGTQIQVVRKPDGRAVLRILSDRAVQEPFLDMVLELNWSNGRLTREFTLLFDPPSQHRQVEAPTAPVVSAPTPAPAPLAPQAQAPAPRPAESPTRAPRPAPSSSAALPTDGDIVVRPGDSLSRVADRNRVEGVSLDQMLVALYRHNPNAFLGENMNLLRAGAHLKMPARDTLLALDHAEAKKLIRAHSADFEAARQGLAAAAPKLPKGGDRVAKGGVDAVVTETKPAPSGDRLTLSKPSAPPPAPAPAVKPAPTPAPAPVVAPPAPAPVVAAKPAPAPASQVAELTRNVEDLKKITEAASAPAPAAAASVALPVPKPAAPKPAAKPAPKPAEDEGLMGLLMSPLGALGALALLGGGAFVATRLRKPKNADNRETMFGESRLQPDSFFGNTGGQRIDTRDGGNTMSSMSYSLSQLDAHGDVDPVAEADVYLAYGRDLQAEEILKEALRAQPERMAIRVKLLEVYAKRRDVRGFEQLAMQLYADTKGHGEDWDKAQEMGRGIDPDNTLYQPGGGPRSMFDEDAPRPEPMNAVTLPAAAAASPSAFAEKDADAGPPSVIDLDLDLGGAPDSSLERTQGLKAQPDALPSVSMDLDLSAPAPAPEPAPAPSGNSLQFSLDDLGDFDAGTVSQPLDGKPIERDSTASKVGGDSLIDAMQDLSEDDGDPMMRQLELAEEFRQIGDVEGARDVLQELVKQVQSGPLYEKAKALLDQLR